MNRIEIRKCGITEAGTDAIVNAANEGLWEGSGVCGAIFAASDRKRLTEACQAIGHCDTGSAVITPGFGLSRFIIHAVGPVWDGENGRAKAQLYSAYQAALKLADENGCQSVGFPLISAGIFGVPVDVAWRKALQACSEYSGSIRIVFAIPDDRIRAAGEKLLAELSAAGRPAQPMIIFHDPDKEYGFLSNWYMSDFTADGIRFNCAEQYLMYRKAVLFGDSAAAEAILQAGSPAVMQTCGRDVKPFDPVVWNGCRPIILYRALMYKFSRNEELKRQLLATGTSILAEGTDKDVIFANGMKRNDPDRFNMSRWRGQNLLGFALMEVRRALQNS